MSFSGWLATISAPDLRAVGEGQLDLGRVGDDVEAGQDVAVEVDDRRRCRARRLARLGVLDDAFGLDQHERRLDGPIDDLGIGGGGRDGSEGVGHGLIDITLRQWRLPRNQLAVEEDRDERDERPERERRPISQTLPETAGPSLRIRPPSRESFSHIVNHAVGRVSSPSSPRCPTGVGSVATDGQPEASLPPNDVPTPPRRAWHRGLVRCRPRDIRIVRAAIPDLVNPAVPCRQGDPTSIVPPAVSSDRPAYPRQR